MERYPGNPVMRGSDVSEEYTFVADPYLLALNGRLYIFFEAFSRPAYLGEIWMASSDDGVSWGDFRRVSVRPLHMSHPEALVHEGLVHVFYNYNIDGLILHRSSPLEGFPSWSEESTIFTGGYQGWHHLIEFTFLERPDAWYFLGITGNGEREDQWIRGRVSPEFTLDWDDAAEINPYPLPNLARPWVRKVSGWLGSECPSCVLAKLFPHPLLDLADYPWIEDIVELSELVTPEHTVLLMGMHQSGGSERAIGAFEVLELTPRGMKGRWLDKGFTFPVSASGWDAEDIHRAHVVRFGDEWVMAYDANLVSRCDDPERGCWQIGIARMPAPSGPQGVSAAR